MCEEANAKQDRSNKVTSSCSLTTHSLRPTTKATSPKSESIQSHQTQSQKSHQNESKALHNPNVPSESFRNVSQIVETTENFIQILDSCTKYDEQ